MEVNAYFGMEPHTGAAFMVALGPWGLVISTSSSDTGALGVIDGSDEDEADMERLIADGRFKDVELSVSIYILSSELTEAGVECDSDVISMPAICLWCGCVLFWGSDRLSLYDEV